MSYQDFNNLFATHKQDPKLNRDFDVAQAVKMVADRVGYDVETPQESYTFRDYVETYLWTFTHTMLKPMAVAVASFLFVVTGSFSVVSASTHALPGEQLYPIKLGVEKAQFALSFSAQQRANLRVEFASRRLEEMVQIVAMADRSTPETVQLAVNRFKTEVVHIQEDLVSGSHAPSPSQKTFAKSVGRKVEMYSSAVASTSQDLTDEMRGEVQTILETTKEQVVEVIISAHEADQDTESARDLDQALATEIETVQALYAEEATVAIATAQQLREEGLYRRAFQVLKDFTFEAQLRLKTNVTQDEGEVGVENTTQVETEIVVE